MLALVMETVTVVCAGIAAAMAARAEAMANWFIGQMGLRFGRARREGAAILFTCPWTGQGQQRHTGELPLPGAAWPRASRSAALVTRRWCPDPPCATADPWS